MPSLASHAGASNRPHVTLVAGTELADSPALRSALSLPLAFRLGGVLLFPTAKRRFVLARAVVTTGELLALHDQVHRTQHDVVSQTSVGAWTPHVTLSMRLTAEQVATAIPLLGEAPDGSFVGARLWDGVEKSIVELTEPV